MPLIQPPRRTSALLKVCSWHCSLEIYWSILTLLLNLYQIKNSVERRVMWMDSTLRTSSVISVSALLCVFDFNYLASARVSLLYIQIVCLWQRKRRGDLIKYVHHWLQIISCDQTSTDVRLCLPITSYRCIQMTVAAHLMRIKQSMSQKELSALSIVLKAAILIFLAYSDGQIITFLSLHMKSYNTRSVFCGC